MPDRSLKLFVFFGLIATGKSTLAQAFARQRGIAYHNSDRVRKELAGIAVTAHRKEGVNEGIYSREFSIRTYDALAQRAEAALQAGNSVVVDGSYSVAEERTRLRQLAARYQAAVCFVLCSCREEELRRRMEERARDPQAVSDGRWEIYLVQKEKFTPPDELAAGELVLLDTDAPLEYLLERLDEKLESIGRGGAESASPVS